MLKFIVRYGYESIARLLLRFGASTQLPNPRNVLPHQACGFGGHAIMERIMKDFFLTEREKSPNYEINFQEQCSYANPYRLELGDDLNSLLSSQVNVLIPFDVTHAGAGSLYVDNCFSEPFLNYLTDSCLTLPVEPPSKGTKLIEYN